jgi:hypothetical protein
MAKRTLIFIDDEKDYTQDWRKWLQEKFNVDYHERIPDTQDLRDRIVSIEACVIIQDIMMEDRNSKTDNILAGIEFAEEIADTLVPLQVPLVFFSNRKFADIEEEFTDLQFPRHLLHYLAKPDVGYRTLASEIERILKIAAEGPSQSEA